MYTQRLREWNVAKNISSQDVREYLQQLKHHPADLTALDGSSSIMLRGRMITERKLLNHVKRRKILHEAEPDQANVEEEESVRTRNASSEGKDECHASLLDTMDEVPYQDCEKILEKDEASIELTSEELTSLSIAILQTAFHYRGDDEDTSPEIQRITEKPVPHPLLALSPSQLLAGPPEMCDLAFILHHSNMVYAQFPNTRNPSSTQPFQLVAKQQSQAKDMYARHWLAGRLTPEYAAHKSTDLLIQNIDQLKPMLLEQHPHFVPWIAFVVCYKGFDRAWDEIVYENVVGISLQMSKMLLGPRHPNSQILQRLVTSTFRKSICLVLLRQVISNFRRELQSSHMQYLDLLARLFETIEKCKNLDGDLVEETLRRWAESSLAIANVVKEEKRTARMKAERNTFDPVHQTAASERNSNASFGQNQGLFTSK